MFWEAQFWAEGFWADGFWLGMNAGGGFVDNPAGGTAGRRRRYYLRVRRR